MKQPLAHDEVGGLIAAKGIAEVGGGARDNKEQRSHEPPARTTPRDIVNHGIRFDSNSE